MRKQAILITGANGEMGQGLLSLIHKNYKGCIIAIDVNPLKQSIAQFCTENIIGDILDKNIIEQLNQKYNFEFIYHLAAILSTKAELSPQLAHRVNVTGTINLLELAYNQGKRDNRSGKFFFPSSIAVYGFKNLKEKIEAGSVKENNYCNPTTIYGCNKLYCELLGLYYSKNYENSTLKSKVNFIDFRAIRFPGIISASTIPTSGTSDYIPEMLHYAANNKQYICFVRQETQIPFIAMPDAINAIINLMNHPKNSLDQYIYNIRAFSPTAEQFRLSLLQYFPTAKISYKVNQKRQTMLDGWPMDTDDSAAQIAWNWKPVYNLDTCLKNYLIPNLKNLYQSEA